ncbi:unnamed protein product [Mytilus coruscus]|uniref:Uncharacterized protein n=1 Tax=Mytilus coruscus TaxID=42192 RepID=A0A6J8EMG7_MYTCO|nr:unnamed protein product [Mytilus coruscus]
MGKIKNVKRCLRQDFSIDAFEKKCGCKIHMQIESASCLYRTLGKEFTNCALKNLIEKGLISCIASYVCDNRIVIDHIDNKENKINDSEKEKYNLYSNVKYKSSPESQNCNSNTGETCEFDHSFIEETVKALKSNNVSRRDMEKLCEALGTYFTDIITKYMKLFSQQYKDVNIVTHLSPKDFLIQRPMLLILLLSNLVGVERFSKFTFSFRKISGMCVLLEHIYSLRNQNFIGIFAFILSYLKLRLTGSKLSHSIDNFLLTVAVSLL